MQKMMFSMMFPLLAIITVAVVAGGIGVLFIALEISMHNEVGAMVIGMALVIGVPLIAFLLQKRVEK